MLEYGKNVPLFPLNTVLFPGMMLPLHIFEERYKAMINHCLGEDNTFGVVLAKTKQAVAPNVLNIFTDDIYDIGTIAHITAIEHLDDDRMNLITVGQERFVVKSIKASADDYLIGEVTPYVLEGDKDTEIVEILAKNLQTLVRQYIDQLSDASGEDLSGAKLPADPQELAYLAGTAMQGPLIDKQRLLSSGSLTQLITRTATVLDRENKILAYMLRAYETHQKAQKPPFVDFSLN